MSQQDAHILDRCDQVVLDLLSPEPPPACAFEVVIYKLGLIITVAFLAVYLLIGSPWVYFVMG